MNHCIGTGVILDMRHLKDEFEAKFGDGFNGNLWRELKPEDFEKACKKDRLEIRKEDWVVVNTGWQHYWRKNNDKYYNYYAGMGPEVAKWLIHEKRIKGITGTWGATDAPLWHYPLKEQMPWLYNAYRKATGKDPDVEFPDYEPCHRLFMQAGVCTIENAGGGRGSSHRSAHDHRGFPVPVRDGGRRVRASGRLGNGKISERIARAREQREKIVPKNIRPGR